MAGFVICNFAATFSTYSLFFIFIVLTGAEPHLQQNGIDDVTHKPYFGIAGLLLTIRGANEAYHKETHVPKKFTRLVDPYKSPTLWRFVVSECSEVWNHAAEDDLHTAATVNLHEMRLFCWAGYKNEDVHSWDHHDWDVTFLRDADALGKAPHAYWWTHKFNTSQHPPAEPSVSRISDL